jgi:hypothetical protein
MSICAVVNVLCIREGRRIICSVRYCVVSICTVVNVLCIREGRHIISDILDQASNRESPTCDCC